jgi:hypothetical protein
MVGVVDYIVYVMVKLDEEMSGSAYFLIGQLVTMNSVFVQNMKYEILLGLVIAPH